MVTKNVGFLQPGSLDLHSAPPVNGCANWGKYLTSLMPVPILLHRNHEMVLNSKDY